jgi:DNA sulfur modification protein DndB
MTTLPAQRLKMGSTTYYLASMPVRELVMVVKPAAEALADWDEMSIEDRFQRDINIRRLHEEVIPYLATHPDRFFGSVIVLIDGGEVEFETFAQLNANLPRAYMGSVEKFGFLTINGADLIALDGQHRLVALREIILGHFDGIAQSGIANDDVSVVFIKNEDIKKTRRIFNKVNRYARSTSRADNLILSEDDGYAIISRRLFNDPSGEWRSEDPRVEEIVNWKNNTLSQRSLQITTISALSLMVKDICLAHQIILDEKSLGGVAADEKLISTGFKHCQEWFASMFEAFKPMREARREAQLLIGFREPHMPYSFLFKPAGQIVLFRAARKAKEMQGKRFQIDEFMHRAARIDWSVNAKQWQNVILVGGAKVRVMAKQSNYEDAAKMVLWCMYESTTHLPSEFFESVHHRWKELNSALALPTSLKN